MKFPTTLALVFTLASTAQAVSNGPRPQYMMNYGCGPTDRIPVECASEQETENYCQGFKGLVTAVSNAGAHIPNEGYAIWCWTILEDWTQCRIPSPKLAFQCPDYVKGLAPQAGKSSCQAVGFEVARKMYLDDVSSKCPATE